jgi:heavy metal efflux system protein
MYNTYNYSIKQILHFAIPFKYLLVGIFLMLRPLSGSSQNDSTLTFLSLKQIIDSALTNHPEIKNAELEILSAKSGFNGAYDIKPIEIQYERGQRYSSTIDYKLEIQQNFGSPVTWIAGVSYSKNLVSLKESKSRLVKVQIINRIKAAYYDCIYEINRIKILDSQNEILAGLVKKIDTLYKNNDTGNFEKILAQSQLAELISQSDEAYNNYLISKNNLSREAYLNSDFDLFDEQLELYEIAISTDTSQVDQFNLLSDYYRKHCSLANASLKLENSKFYPEITAGYFNQSIDKGKRFTGFQVGLVAPLWFIPQMTKRKNAIIKKQTAQNEFDLQKFNAQNNSEKLRIELNKYFEKLNYYYDFALAHADTLERMAIKQINKLPVNINEYIQSIGIAYNIRLGYLETLNNYNQAAIELELYSSY